MSHTAKDAVRMLGHLLEHNGIVGPIAVNRAGDRVLGQDPTACGWCMIGATSLISETLQVSYPAIEREIYKAESINPESHAERCGLGDLWEQWHIGQPTSTPQYRLDLARRLQAIK